MYSSLRSFNNPDAAINISSSNQRVSMSEFNLSILARGTYTIVLSLISGPLQPAQGQNQAPSRIDHAGSGFAQLKLCLGTIFVGSSMLKAGSVSLMVCSGSGSHFQDLSNFGAVHILSTLRDSLGGPDSRTPQHRVRFLQVYTNYRSCLVPLIMLSCLLRHILSFELCKAY
jgi:hypothetical protein